MGVRWFEYRVQPQLKENWCADYGDLFGLDSVGMMWVVLDCVGVDGVLFGLCT